MDHLETFRIRYGSSKVLVYDDCLVYRVANRFAPLAAKDANKLIEKLQLPLVATPTDFSSNDSFSIKPL